MFGSQAENCGSKSPYPFIKWEQNLTVAPRWILRTTYVLDSCVLETFYPLTCCSLGARSKVGLLLEGERCAEGETNPRKLSLGPLSAQSVGRGLVLPERARFYRNGAPEKSASRAARAPSRPVRTRLVNLAALAPARGCEEDGEPSYRRVITIVNIHGWLTYHP